MAGLDIHNLDGGVVGTVELPAAIFEVDQPSSEAIYFSVKAFQNAQRQGNADTLTRAEVNRTKRKPWRQKGTGRSRSGTRGSPLWVGGGTAHGPHPNGYREKVPKKVRRLALKSALTIKMREGQVRVLEDISLETPRTKKVADLMRAMGLQNHRALLVVNPSDPILYKSCRNISGLDVKPANSFSVYDVMRSETVLFTTSALNRLSEVWDGP